MKASRRLALALAGAAAAASVTACGGGGGGGDASGSGERTVKISLGVAPAGAAVSTGIQQGRFREQGLAVETSSVESPPARVAAVQSGSVDVVELPTPAFVNAVGRGLPIHALAAQYGYPEGVDSDPYESIDVLVAPGSAAHGMGDLAGATIAVPARQDLMEILASSEITEAGGDPRSVKWIVLDFQSQVAALKAGRVDAILVPFPFSALALGDGARSIARPAGDFFGTAPTTIWAVGERVAQDKDLVQRLQRGIYASNAYADASENRTAFVQATAARSGIPVELFEKSGVAFYFPLTLEAADLQATADKMNRLGFLEQPVDVTGRVLAPPAAS